MRIFLLSTLSLFVLPLAAEAGERRIAIVMGNNVGGPEDVVLRYAHRDAARVGQVLEELGGVSRKDLHLLLEEDANELRTVMRQVEEEIARSQGPSRCVLLLLRPRRRCRTETRFVYSGVGGNPSPLGKKFRRATHRFG